MRVQVVIAVIVLLVAFPAVALADASGSPWPITPTAPNPVRVTNPAPGPGSFPLTCTVNQPAYPSFAGDAPGKKVYVALGDSYAAGEGAPELVKDDCGVNHDLFITGTSDVGNHCHRSPEAYPARLEQLLGSGWALDHRACSGATTKNFTATQKWDQPNSWKFWESGPKNGNPPQWSDDPLNSDPEGIRTVRKADLVTLTMGGNDLGFADVVANCIDLVHYANGVKSVVNPLNWVTGDLPPATCQAQDGEVRGKVDDLQMSLTNILNSIRRDGLNPGGRVLVLGYPHPFPASPPDFCSVGALLPINKGDMVWLNNVADYANATLREAARVSGSTYVDIADLFTQAGQSHDGCVNDGGDRWINRTIPSHREWSWHPKAAAHEAEAKALETCLMATPGTPVCSPLSAPPAGPRLPQRSIGNPNSSPWPISVGSVLPQKGPSSEQPYVRYANGRLGCSAEENGPGYGARVAALGYGDATDDGVDDAVIAIECVSTTSGWPQSVLVLDGASDHASAAIVDTLIDGEQGSRVQLDTIRVEPGTVVLDGQDFGSSGHVETESPFSATFNHAATGFVRAVAGPGASTPAGGCTGATPQLVVTHKTKSSTISICSDDASNYVYSGRSSAGTLSVPATLLGSGTYRATNTVDGSVYTYLVGPTALIISRDGATISTQPYVG